MISLLSRCVSLPARLQFIGLLLGSHYMHALQTKYTARGMRWWLPARCLPHTVCSQAVHCAQLLRQMLAGAAYIHAQGVIHRDLKPANIFYDPRGEIKLVRLFLLCEPHAHIGAVYLCIWPAAPVDMD